MPLTTITTTTTTLILILLPLLLHSNLTFAPSRETEGGSRATVPADCRRIATLFGLNPDHLENSICTRTTVINNEITIIPLTPEKAVDQRDTLAKYIYNKIFTTIVMRLNTSLYRGKPGNNIGILDIFGFEVFQLNSFEQLCINYCNERLQTFFNEIIFESEMKLYSEEGLPCEDISFQVRHSFFYFYYLLIIFTFSCIYWCIYLYIYIYISILININYSLLIVCVQLFRTISAVSD